MEVYLSWLRSWWSWFWSWCAGPGPDWDNPDAIDWGRDADPVGVWRDVCGVSSDSADCSDMLDNLPDNEGDVEYGEEHEDRKIYTQQELVTATETYYAWREYKIAEGEETPRLFVPWTDPMVYEYPMDFLFDTIEDAKKIKEDMAPDEKWWLVKVTTEIVNP